MKVYFVGEKAKLKHKMLVKRAIKEVIKFLNQPNNVSVCVNFVDDQGIRELNNLMRGIDKVTDVLSFPTFDLKAGEILDTNSVDAKVCSCHGVVPIGDMAIDILQLLRQAEEYEVTLEQELAKLVVHSVLHLFGYDHIKDEDYIIMKEKEDKILSKMTKS